MKYVVLITDEGETPIIFPERLFHDEIANAVENREVVSAGFVRLSGSKIECYGESLGLELSSREEADASLIQHHMTTEEV